MPRIRARGRVYPGRKFQAIRRRRLTTLRRLRAGARPPGSMVGWKKQANLGLGFPRQLKMVHKYVELLPLTSTTGSPAHYRFSTNGMYDPNITGTGHQPLYFDQMTAIYDHYCVIGSKFKISWAHTAAEDIPVVLTTYVNDDTTEGNANPAFQAEYQSAKYKMIVGKPVNPTVKTLRWSARKYFGKSPLANTELQGTSSTNPTEQSYYNIDFVAADLASTVQAFFMVEIEFIAIWKEIIDIAAS